MTGEKRVTPTSSSSQFSIGVISTATFGPKLDPPPLTFQVRSSPTLHNSSSLLIDRVGEGVSGAQKLKMLSRRLLPTVAALRTIENGRGNTRGKSADRYLAQLSPVLDYCPATWWK